MPENITFDSRGQYTGKEHKLNFCKFLIQCPSKHNQKLINPYNKHPVRQIFATVYLILLKLSTYTHEWKHKPPGAGNKCLGISLSYALPRGHINREYLSENFLVK